MRVNDDVGGVGFLSRPVRNGLVTLSHFPIGFFPDSFYDRRLRPRQEMGSVQSTRLEMSSL